MRFVTRKMWPLAAGFIVASIVMMIFEFINSLIFPLPNNLDWNDTEAVRAFSASMPWTSYILVLLGWIAGSFIGGCVTTYLAREKEYRVSFALGILLTIAGAFDIFILGIPLLFAAIALPQFLIFTYLGHRYLMHAHKKKTARSLIG